MKGLIYVSQTPQQWTQEELDGLVSLAKLKNEVNQITGFLFFSDRRFLQYIEGEVENIDSLYLTINQDPRHSINHSVIQNIGEKRFFPNWKMAKILRIDLVEYQMERALLDYMFMFDGKVYPKLEKHDSAIWRMVKKISDHRAEFHV